MWPRQLNTFVFNYSLFSNPCFLYQWLYNTLIVCSTLRALHLFINDIFLVFTVFYSRCNYNFLNFGPFNPGVRPTWSPTYRPGVTVEGGVKWGYRMPSCSGCSLAVKIWWPTYKSTTIASKVFFTIEARDRAIVRVIWLKDRLLIYILRYG